MVIIEDGGNRLEISARLAAMMRRLLEAQRIIEAATKGRIELNFAGDRVRKSVTICDD